MTFCQAHELPGAQSPRLAHRLPGPLVRGEDRLQKGDPRVETIEMKGLAHVARSRRMFRADIVGRRLVGDRSVIQVSPRLSPDCERGAGLGQAGRDRRRHS
jgi:hypothetical protein